MFSAEVEKGAAAGTIASIKAHDSKRFRLRAVSHEAEVYERYFHKSIAKKVSWVQLGIAAFVLIAQMIVMFVLMDRFEFYETGAQMAGGIWASIAIALSAITTLWAAKKPSYGKLHASMALHIISVLVQIFATFILFAVGIPELRRSIRSIHRGDYRDKYDNHWNRNYVLEASSNNVLGVRFIDGSDNGNHTTTEPNSFDAYSNQRNNNNNFTEDPEFLLHQLNLAFTLNAMMSFAGIVQILMSFFMSLKTGRAICCGRTHLEGKFLEMEAVGRDDADAVVNFRMGAKEKTQVAVHANRSNSIGPPPSYCPDLFNPTPSAVGDTTIIPPMHT